MNNCVAEKEISSPVSIGFDSSLTWGSLECNVFRSCGSVIESEYFYGGALWDRDEQTFTLYKDILRPNMFTRVSADDIIFVCHDAETIDIMLDKGIWISGSPVQKVKSDRCNYRLLKFDDKRILSVHNGIAVVDLTMLRISPVELAALRHNLQMERETYTYPNPLTIAYEKTPDGVNIGFWDILEKHFVGRKEVYWCDIRDPLDINF